MVYKLVKDKTIVGVVQESDFRRFQVKHKRVLFSDVEQGEFVECNGAYYRDNWLRVPPAGAPTCIEVSIVRINRNEYDEIVDQLDDGTIPDDGSLEEETEVVVDEPEEDTEEETVVKTAAQILEEQIRLAARYAEV